MTHDRPLADNPVDATELDPPDLDRLAESDPVHGREDFGGAASPSASLVDRVAGNATGVTEPGGLPPSGDRVDARAATFGAEDAREGQAAAGGMVTSTGGLQGDSELEESDRAAEATRAAAEARRPNETRDSEPTRAAEDRR